jgi:hypothetical protein
MTFFQGRDQRLLYGAYDLSSYAKDSNVDDNIAMLDKTTLGQNAMVYQAGLESGQVTFNGFVDNAVAGSRTVLLAAKQLAGNQPVTTFPNGYGTNGNPADILLSRFASFKEGGSVADLVNLAITIQADGGIDANGVVLHLLQAETAATNTTAVDNLALSSNGGVGNLHVTAFSGTDITIKIQHAAVSTYADLVSFTQNTAIGSEQKVVAAGTTVNRNLRVLWTGTFVSCTFVVSFARR